MMAPARRRRRMWFLVLWTVLLLSPALLNGGQIVVWP